MVRFVLGWVMVALIIGCSSKEEKSLVKAYTQNNAYHKNLQRTEKVELYDGNTSVAILTATHMYQPILDKNDSRDEVFIISVAFEEPEMSHLGFDSNTSLTKDNVYTLTLNNKKPLAVKHLDVDDEKLKNVSFVTGWGEYYEVIFPHAPARFTLEFSHKKYGKGLLYFSKKPKFVYTNKGF